MLFGQRRERVLRLLADREQLAFEGVLICGARATRDDCLTDDGHLLDDRRAEASQIGRHLAPAEQDLAFFGDKALELLADEAACRFVLRQEAQRDRIIARRRQVDARLRGPIAEQRVGDLD